MKPVFRLLPVLLALFGIAPCAAGQTIALWPFDEPRGLYPSCVLDDVSDNNCPMVLGPGGQIVAGKFGNALEPLPQPPITYPASGSVLFGLAPAPKPAGRTVEPMNWKNALFCALMTSGETHLRKEVGFVNPSRSRLNLGNFDWTVEFWYLPARRQVEPGVVFELGSGPRGENDEITRLAVAPDGRSFLFVNKAGGLHLRIPTSPSALDPSRAQWCHCAFVYSATESRIRHYVDGKEQAPSAAAVVQSLPQGEEAYLSVGRDGVWGQPLPGRIDELRFSEGRLYTADFVPPASFAAPMHSAAPKTAPKKGPLLLFARGAELEIPIQLLDGKHLFFDGAIAERLDGITFNANPPRPAERVVDNIQGPFRKHLNVVEDETGLIRMYFGVQNDYLAVLTSRDGIRWEKPLLNPGSDPGMENVVIPEPTAMGQVFLDPNGPPGERWKYISGYEGRGIYLYSSPDGWRFKRCRTAALPFRSGSQSNIFYDDQRQLYVSYHRSDFPRTLGGKTQREFVRVESADLTPPWSFTSQTQAEVIKIAETKRLHPLIPWYLDNGPLTPGGFGVEFPTAFGPDDALDPEGTDLYVPKAMKYPWAPDAYLAFPLIYFHYEEEGPPARRVLGVQSRQRGSGPIEAQLSVSRDGIHWKRFPRPAYVGTGTHAGDRIHQVYMAHGMVRRGDEIWQYYFGEEAYHSSWKKGTKRAVYRVVQRLDGFVSADAPYDREAVVVTKPLVFRGDRLLLNIDTDAAGYAQVGILDGRGHTIEGFSADECVYINGDFTAAEVEWLGKGKDLSSLQGKPVKVLLRLRGARLYSMQFSHR
ncbi:MAG: LamG domain-containing protein [Acidobacteria bacterium]|nr:LamG domain-containing protein [Acidobacteriota bacterium]